MNDSLQLKTRHFPSRMAELGFSVPLPQDWIAHDLPAEETDFSNPAQFAPLAVVTAPHSAIVFAFAARPAFDDGCLNDWAHYLLAQNGLQPNAIGEHRAGRHAALVGEAVQPSELGPMVVRFAFFEDGGRLLNITLSAPQMLAGVVTGAWFAALEAFALETPRGATAALYSPVELPPVADGSPVAVEAQEQEASAAESQAEALAQTQRTDGQPTWWHLACELEAAGRLQEAEQTIMKAVDHIGASASVAELYSQRMMRLLRSGDTAGAQQAYEQAASWITWYASQATSGGEGAALSRERDLFRAELDRLYGAHSAGRGEGA